jgi:hypothetical protein
LSVFQFANGRVGTMVAPIRSSRQMRRRS